MSQQPSVMSSESSMSRSDLILEINKNYGQFNRGNILPLPPIEGNDPKQNGQPKKTVEGLLEVALRAVSNSTAYVCLASRTDKGVSAKINYGVGDSSEKREVVRSLKLLFACVYIYYTIFI